MATLLALLLVSALRLLAARDCTGTVWLNQTDNDDCTLRITVDVSHCGFLVIPEYRIFDDHLMILNCSQVVNPRPTQFEMWCTIPFDPFPPLHSIASRRLIDFTDAHAVVRWTATDPAFVDFCKDTIANLTECEDANTNLSEEIDILRMTATTTTGTMSTDTHTTVSQTTTPEGATTTVTSTKTTTTRTDTTPADGAVVDVGPNSVGIDAAGIPTECDSLLPFLIASLVFNGLSLLTTGNLLLLRRRAYAPKAMACQVSNFNTPRQTWEVDASRSPSRAVQSVRSRAVSFEPGVAASRGTDLTNRSVGTDESAEGVQSAEQRASFSWAGRSIIYRYLRFAPREGNCIEATSRRGWRINAAEPPSMEGDQSASNSRAPEGGSGADGAGGTSKSCHLQSAGEASASVRSVTSDPGARSAKSAPSAVAV